jgi:hypothetical protein
MQANLGKCLARLEMEIVNGVVAGLWRWPRLGFARLLSGR